MSPIPEHLSQDEYERIFREEVIPEAEFHLYTPQEHPRAVILAGQPGAGKGTLKDAVKIEFGENIFAIDPDQWREFDPVARSAQKATPYGWTQQTNDFASETAWRLRAAGETQRFNLLIDTTLGNADGATHRFG